MALVSRKYFTVYVKSAWADSWVERFDITPLSATLAAAPALGQAKLVLRYGDGYFENLSRLTPGEQLENLANCYVAITQSDSSAKDGEKLLFVGYIPGQSYMPLGVVNTVKTVDQSIQAVAIDYLLTLERMDGAVVTDGTTTQWIEQAVEFNNRKRSGKLEGNRSASKVSFEGVSTYVFDSRPGYGQIWSVWDMLEYLVKRHFPITGPVFDFPPEYYSDAIRPAEIDCLTQFQTVYSYEGKSLRTVLAELISPARGMSWAAFPDLTGQIDIQVWSILENDLTIGSVTIPAHSALDRVTSDPWYGASDQDIQIFREDASLADRVIVRGAMIKATATFWFGDELGKGWTTAAETAYKAAASGSAGYPAYEDEQAVVNDAYRTSDQFGKVFTEFIVPASWNWIIQGADLVNRKWDAWTAEFLDVQGAYWNYQKQFLPWLPFKEGYDYSGDSPFDTYPAGFEDQQRKIFVVAVDPDGQWVDLEKCKHAPTIQPAENRMGVRIRFNPQHFFAKNDWAEAEPSKVDDDLAAEGFDFNNILVTAMFETDQRMEVLAQQGTLRENIRTVTIDIPWAELWTVTPNTLIGLDADNAPVLYGLNAPYAVRDDRGILLSVLAAAAAYYGRVKYKTSFKTAELGFTASLGTMLMGLDIDGDGTHGACITAITWNLGSDLSASIVTDHGELDFAGLAGMTAATGPAAGQSIRRGPQEVSMLKRDVNELRQNVSAMTKSWPSQVGASIPPLICEDEEETTSV